MSLLLPTQRLEDALNAYEAPHPVHTGGSSTNPPPNLQIDGLPDPLTLPLQRKQANQLIKLAKPSPHGQAHRTVIDPLVRNSYELQPSQVHFTTKRWKRSLQTIVNTSVRGLGINPREVNHEFYKLLLYNKGGHFRAHCDTEKLPGMFATLVIQLPSAFRGGQLVVRHLGEEAVYSGGADDASSSDKIYHTAFFADVEHELRPITQGYRIALVYNLIWSAQAPDTSPNQNNIAPVASALRELTQNAPCDAWMLAMPLHHAYTMSSLESFGIRSLKNHDASKVTALRHACKEMNTGDLEVVACLLKSKGREQRDDEDDEEVSEYKGIPCLKTAYATDGSEFPYKLRFVDFQTASQGGEFVLENRSEPLYTGNEGFVSETMYRAVIALMWPKAKRLEVLSGDSWNLQCMLEEGSERQIRASIDRILAWYDSVSGTDVSVKNVEVIMNSSVVCVARQAGSTVKFAMNYVEHDEIREPTVALVSRFGWKRFAVSLEGFLCPSRLETIGLMEGPLKMLRDLGRIVPQEIRVNGLERLFDIHRGQRKVFEAFPFGKYRLQWESWVAEKKLFVRLSMVILESIVAARTEVEGTRAQRLDVLVDRISQMWDESNEEYLTDLDESIQAWNESEGSELAESIKTKLHTRAQGAQVEKFMTECAYIVEALRREPPKNAPKDFGKTLIGAKFETSYESFIKLAFRVLSREEVSAEVSSMYKRFVSTIPKLCQKSIASITNSVEDLQTRKKCVLPYIHGTVIYLKDQEDKKRLQQEEGRTIEETATEPPDLQRAYPNLSTGIPKIDRFLHSRSIETVIRAQDEDKADEICDTIRRVLPEGFGCDCREEGSVWVMELIKPCFWDCRRRIKYEKNVKKLEDVRNKIRDIERRKRQLPDEGVMESVTKRARRSDLQVMWKVYKM